MLRSLAYGALIGTGAGLIAGAADIINGRKGIGYHLINTMNRGGGLGLALGTIWGGIDALNKGDTRSLGSGAAWGYLGGVVAGAGVAIYQQVRGSAVNKSAAMTYNVVMAQDSNSQAYPQWRMSRRF